MIVKPDKEEAEMLARCLKYVASHVDEICITQAGDKPCKEVSDVIKTYNGKESFFKWNKRFDDARNYNFSQATGDYIFWLDCDDVVKGAAHLRDLVKMMDEKKVECVAMNYLYDFNENKECTVKHVKTRIVQRGCVKWVGAVHEDFEKLREISTFFAKDTEVLHIKTKEQTEESARRNLEIAKNEMVQNPDDPRSLWLAANGYWGVGDIPKAIEMFEQFVKESSSDDEKYIAYLTLSSLKKSEEDALKALSLKPTLPNAYFRMAELKFDAGKYLNCISFIELGLQLPVPDTEIVVYNPRDYDYNPLMMMMKAYWKIGKTKKSVEIVNEMAKMFPNDEEIQNKQKLLASELGDVLKVEKYLEKARKIKDKIYLKKYLDGLPEKLQQHPEVCIFRNENFIKEETSGKDITYYCGYTEKVWNPEIAMEKGVGGSEEAVINLSKELTKKGWNVTVYNNCGHGGVFEGVTYKPFWSYNYRDKQDITIFWRHPKPVDYVDERSGKIFIDMHDVVPKDEFTDERLKKITKIMVKTKAHRVLFPNVPDEKIAIIPNGIDPSLFEKRVEKNPYLILNTSSADRHLDATLDVFEELIKRQPDKPWKLAWYYGWGVYDSVHEGNKEMMEWKKKQMERFEKLVKEGRAEGGTMLSHAEIAKKYLEAKIFLYPTSFYEIHCISALKAQVAGCMVVCSDFAALDETVVFGKKIHTNGEKWGRENTFGDTANVQEYVDFIERYEKNKFIYWHTNVSENYTGKKLGEDHNWLNISNQWHENL